jgi:hypothetical protein
VHHHLRLVLNGTLDGRWQVDMSIPDTGEHQTLTGSGSVTPLGTVQATADLHSPGFISNGRTTGTLVLSNARGTVQISLKGPSQSGFSGPPSTFVYAITGGTGAYAFATGHGRAHLTEVVADAVPVTSSNAPNLPVIVGPIFALTIHSS